MSDDLVARLRDRANADWRGRPPDAIYAEAADRIEALTAERDALREALEMACEAAYSDPESAARNYIDQARVRRDPEGGQNDE